MISYPVQVPTEQVFSEFNSVQILAFLTSLHLISTVNWLEIVHALYAIFAFQSALGEFKIFCSQIRATFQEGNNATLAKAFV